MHMTSGINYRGGPLPRDAMDYGRARGWSNAGRNPVADAERNGCSWNPTEEDDLRQAFAVLTQGVRPTSAHVAELAAVHGRTPLAIQLRLEQLKLLRPGQLDFGPVDDGPREPRRLRQGQGQQARRLRVLLDLLLEGAAPRQTFVAVDVAALEVEGLVESCARSGPGVGVLRLTDRGLDRVEALLERSSALSGPNAGGVRTVFNTDRGTSVVCDDQAFFMVASGDCMQNGRGGAQLKKPPVHAHGAFSAAAAEADRLAAESRDGETFFVLRAVSSVRGQRVQPRRKVL